MWQCSDPILQFSLKPEVLNIFTKSVMNHVKKQEQKNQCPQNIALSDRNIKTHMKSYIISKALSKMVFDNIQSAKATFAEYLITLRPRQHFTTKYLVTSNT